MTGMEIEEAEQFIEDFFAGFPDLKKWIDEQGKFATRWWYSKSARGRKRFYVPPDASNPEYAKLLKQIARWAGNMPIQSTNVDMLKMAAAMIYRDIRGGKMNGVKLYDAHFMLMVHDEIVMHSREDHVAPVKAIMERRMNEAYWNIIPRWDADKNENGLDDDGNPIIQLPWGVLNKIDVVVSDMWEKA
jgi:DNA polymerase-1